MKRFILIIVPAGLFVGLLLYAGVFQKHQKLDRYYTSIGVNLYKVEPDILSMYDENGQEYLNDNGQFTNLILIRDILDNGPAAKAGLRDMDVLLEVDGRQVDGKEIRTLSFFGVNYALASGKPGDVSRLKIRRMDTNGNPLEDHEFDVRKEIIDKVAWLPMGRWLHSGVGSGYDYEVQVGTMVHEVKDGNQNYFAYKYKVENLGSKVIEVKWKINFWDKFKSKKMLKPGQNMEYTTISDNFPVESSREVSFLVDEPGQSRFVRSIKWFFGVSEKKFSATVLVPVNQ